MVSFLNDYFENFFKNVIKGTGGLIEFLSAHPNISAPPNQMEINFFQKENYKLGYEWYK